MSAAASGWAGLVVAVGLSACGGRGRAPADPESGAANYDPLTVGTVTEDTRRRAEADRPPERSPKKPRPEVGVKRSQPFDTDLIVYDGRTVRLKREITFGGDHQLIEDAGGEVVDDVVWMLESGTEITKMEIQVHAHPEMVEPDRQITQLRADTIKRYMVERGIAADRIIAHGYEATVPLDSNATAAGRERNDRIEFVVVEVDGEPIVGGEAPP